MKVYGYPLDIGLGPFPLKNYLRPEMVIKYFKFQKKRGLVKQKNTSLLLCDRMTAGQACLR